MAADAGECTVRVKVQVDRTEVDRLLAQLEAARSRLLEAVKVAATAGRAIEIRVDGEVLATAVLASRAFQEAVGSVDNALQDGRD